MAGPIGRRWCGEVCGRRNLFARFVLVGCGTTFLYATALVVAKECAALPAYVSVGIAYVVGIIFNYWGHYLWTFSADAPHRTAAPRYSLMVAGIFLFNIAATAIFTDVLNFSYVVVQGSIAVIVGLATFIVQLRWIFTTGRS